LSSKPVVSVAVSVSKVQIESLNACPLVKFQLRAANKLHDQMAD